MADENQYKLIIQGVDVWNKWREEHPEVNVNLANARLNNTNLRNANLANVYLKRAELVRADLGGADLNGAILNSADLSNADLSGAKLNNAKLFGTKLNDANFNGVKLRGAKFTDAILNGADLNNTDLSGTNFNNAKLINTNLRGAKLKGADFIGADLSGADLRDADLNNTDFRDANLFNARLQGADFMGADLKGADLLDADLSGVNLQYANLIETNLDQAILSNCKLYGIAVWNLKGTPKTQTNLIITHESEAVITVDDIQVAQFIYLLLNNKNVRNVITTITSKAVLILGRFTPERKEVLDLVREELRKHDYVPILFDFANTENQSLLETVMTLAGMARFIIADVTAATMIREELRSIVEKYPSKPIQPILITGEQEYVTLPEMFRDYKNILKTFIYRNNNEIIAELKEDIIQPAESWLEARKNQLMGGGKTQREIELERENELLRKLLQERSA